MKKAALHLFMATGILLSIACTKEKTKTEEPPLSTYAISGTVKDGTGKPVAGARIRVENPTGNNIHYNTTSNAEGKYSVKVSAIGGYTVFAWKEVEAGSEVYQLRMGMEKDADYDAFNVPPAGVTKNFEWKLSGRIPDRVVSKENGTGYFGGTIKFVNFSSLADQMPAGTQVTVKFTPETNARYLDGSSATGKSIERKITIVDGVGQAYYINDIPATNYILTASVIVNGAVKPVFIGSGNPDQFAFSAEHFFKAEGGSGTKESGLGSPNEYSYYLMHP